MTRSVKIMVILAGAGLFLLNSLNADSVVIEKEDLYPEGVAYDTNRSLYYVSSVSKGSVSSVNENGDIKEFVKDDKLISTIGLTVDGERNRLLVCVADPGAGDKSNEKSKGNLAGLAIYDLDSKKELAFYRLGALFGGSKHFANDVTFDSKGNIYVTDSFSPAIYKIDRKGAATLFVSDQRWAVKSGFGLNGIAWHADGFLVVCHYNTGKLYKIDIQNPRKITEIAIDQTSLDKTQKIVNLDGLLLLNPRTLIAVSNNISGKENGNGVYRLRANKDWTKLSIGSLKQLGSTFPSTLAKNKDDVYVIHAKLLQLFSGKKIPVKIFEIEKVLFIPTKAVVVGKHTLARQ